MTPQEEAGTALHTGTQPSVISSGDDKKRKEKKEKRDKKGKKEKKESKNKVCAVQGGHRHSYTWFTVVVARAVQTV